MCVRLNPGLGWDGVCDEADEIFRIVMVMVSYVDKRGERGRERGKRKED